MFELNKNMQYILTEIEKQTDNIRHYADYYADIFNAIHNIRESLTRFEDELEAEING